MNHTFEYHIPQEKVNELKTFISKCNKEIGGVDTIHVDMITGTSQSPFTVIRYTYDTGNVDDYGKPIKGTKFVMMVDGENTGGYGISQIGYFDPEKSIYIHTDKFSIILYGIEDVNRYFIEKYLDDIKMRIIELKALDPVHNNDYEIMFTMIKGVEGK